MYGAVRKSFPNDFLYFFLAVLLFFFLISTFFTIVVLVVVETYRIYLRGNCAFQFLKDWNFHDNSK